MIPISNTELAGNQRNMEKGTVNDIYDDFQGNDGHFIGDWLNIVYRYFSNTPRKFSRFPNERSLYSTVVLCFILFYTSFPQPFSTIRSLAMAYHVIDQWIV